MIFFYFFIMTMELAATINWLDAYTWLKTAPRLVQEQLQESCFIGMAKDGTKVQQELPHSIRLPHILYALKKKSFLIASETILSTSAQNLVGLGYEFKSTHSRMDTVRFWYRHLFARNEPSHSRNFLFIYFFTNLCFGKS